MPVTSNKTSADKGINSDLSLFNNGGLYSPFLLNASIEDKTGEGYSVQNMESNILAIKFAAGYKVIGKAEIQEQNRVLYALLNSSTGASEIGEVSACNYDDNSDDAYGNGGCVGCSETEQRLPIPLEKIIQTPYCEYRTIISNACLAFNLDNPVNIEYRLTDCGVNIYFTDALNDMRFMYFTYTNNNPRGALVLDNRFKVIEGYTAPDCIVPIYGTDLDCNKIKYNPIHTIPCVSEMVEVQGGSNPAGVYQVLLAYSDAQSNPLSQYYPATQPIPIFTKYITVETNYPTDKALSITINGLDTNTLFSYYNLVIAETVDNFTTFKLAGTFPVTKNKYVYTGDDKTLPVLTPSDVLFKRIFYQSARSITKSNNFLFFADVDEYNKPNLQSVADNIHLYWQTVAIPESVYSDPRNSWKFRSNMRDEVYAYGLVFVTDTGEDLCVVHIPGRKPFSTDLEIIDNNDVLEDTTCGGLSRNQRWQVYNTSTVTSIPHEITTNCDDTKCWEEGQMSYWESTETYPDDPNTWGDLCGKPIRHHKFPDSCVTHIHDGLYEESGTTKDYTDNNIVYPIGIRVDHNSVLNALIIAVNNGIITQADSDRIIGYRIVRGNRVGNKSIVAKGLLFDMWSYDKFNQKHYYANYPYNDLRDDNFISNDKNTYDGSNTSSPIPNVFTKSSRYTFHSPDTHFVNPTLGTELHLETEEFGQSEGYFNLADQQAKYRFLSTFAAIFTLASGIAAAWSATGEKECIAYTFKSKSVDVGVTTGVTTYNYRPFVPYGKNSGIYDPLESTLVAESTKTTCTGTKHQLLGPTWSGNVELMVAFGVNILNQTIDRITLGLHEQEISKNLILSLLPLKNMSIQYNSVGKYNNYKCVATDAGTKIRAILKSAYLDPENQVVNEDIPASGTTFSSIYVNNWGRESSVYLKTDNTIPLDNTTVQDTSRGGMDDFGLGYDDLGNRVYRNISSYYASLKNFVPDQYGDIFKIDYLETNGCMFSLASTYDNCSHVFGGDVFINRFALKIKVPFFLQTRFKTIDEGSVKYSDLGNLGYPNYYFNTDESLLQEISDEGVLKALLNIRNLAGAAPTRLDAKTEKLFYQNGYIHLYNYGIPYFLVESDVNVDLRYGTDNKEHDFYPHQPNLDFWLQEKNVPISYDNFYEYNRTYSKQNHESIICVNQATFDNRECKITHPNRVIYYDEVSANKFGDNWIVSKVNNYYDFPLSLGKLTSVDGIENEKVLVRFENGFQIFNAYDVIKTQSGGADVQIGSGGIFATRPQDFSTTTLGYAGSQHKPILHTEFGHIFPDARRGQVFNLAPNAKGIDDLCEENVRNWFKENLPFTLLKQFPTLEDQYLDNTFRGIGLAMAFDKRYDRFFLTKWDYKKNTNGITEDAGHFYINASGSTMSCDPGYTLVGNLCTKTTTVPAEKISSLPDFIPVSRKAQVYGQFGSVVYDEGYNVNGTGEFTALDPGLTNTVWSNPAPYTDLVGPVNRSGIWNSLGDEPFNEWVGVTVEVDIPESKVYYVGIAGDNKARIKIGCNLVVDFDPDAMAINHGTDTQVTFKLFHVYPVSLDAGSNFIELYGLNIDQIAVFAAEIYNNTRDELFAATSTLDLDIIFTTASLIGTTISNFNYMCPDCQSPIRHDNTQDAPTHVTTTTCPPGYVLTGDTCVKTTSIPATVVNSLPDFIAVGKKDTAYGYLGTAVYNSGFNVNGTGTYTMINNAETNNFWINTPPSSLTGPVNRNGIWNSLGDGPFDEWIGFTKLIEAPTTGTYYVGVAADNAFRIKLGCNLLVDSDAWAMGDNHGQSDARVPFTIFHIYPVTLQAGANYLELYVTNYGSVSVFAAEVYNNTRAQILAAKSEADLNVLFSTSTVIGQHINNFNYSCANCLSPVKQDDGSYNCVTTVTTAPTVTTTTIYPDVAYDCIVTLTKAPNLTPIRTEVFLDDNKYFCNKSWTRSYNFIDKEWKSFHSFIPNYYIQHIDYFQAGINGNSQSSVWSQGVTNKSYQVYFGKLYPFIVESVSERPRTSYMNNQRASQQNFSTFLAFDVDVLRYHNEYDWSYKRDITFNKAIVFNQRQCSGLLELVVKNEEDLSSTGKYPLITDKSIKVEVTNSNNVWNLNHFWDNVDSQTNNVPIWLLDCSNVMKTLNPRAFNFYRGEQMNAEIRGQYVAVRYIQDVESRFKFIFKEVKNNQQQSVR